MALIVQKYGGSSVADAKRKIIDSATEEYYKAKKKQEEQALEEKIKQLKANAGKFK